MAHDDRNACSLPKQYLAALTGYTYVRIGLFVTTPQDGLENFCDVHIRLSTGVVSGNKVWYSGPTDSIRQIANLKRSRREQDDYETGREVSPALDIMSGGEAIGWDAGHKALDLWLFGPLIVFDRNPVGALFLKLTGDFRPGRARQPMEMRWSTWAHGLDDFPIPPSYPPPSAMERQLAYERQKALTHALQLPPKTKLSWKLEALHHNLNVCEVVKQYDVSKRLNR